MGKLTDTGNRQFLLQKTLNRILFNMLNANENNDIPYKKGYIEYFTQFGCEYFAGDYSNTVSIITSKVNDSDTTFKINILNSDKTKIDSYSKQTYTNLVEENLIGFPITMNLVIKAFKEKYRNVLDEQNFPDIKVEYGFPKSFYRVKLGSKDILFRDILLNSQEDFEKLYKLFLES